MYEELAKKLRYLASVYSICGNENTNEYRLAVEAADAIEDLSKMLDEEVEINTALECNMPVWIPVSERLPEEYKYVLCKTDYGMEVGYHCNEWGQDEWTTGKFASGSFDVTHWMPLPEPPKADKGGAE